jgi:drug/metabolite transporter (DMT)-like permease
MHPRDSIPQALLLALTGYVVLSCGDAVMKSMAGAWPALAVVALRFALGAAGLGVILLWRRGRAGFVTPRPLLQLGRGAALAGASLSFIFSLFIMPMAEAVAILFAGPIVTALVSAAVLGEKLPRATWGSMLLASIGVVVVLRPNVAELGWTALLPLASTIIMSAFLLLNRATARDTTALGAMFWASAWATPVCAVAALIGHASDYDALHIGPLPASVLMRCAIVAVTASVAHSLIFMATMRASAASIVPAGYVQIIMALALGLVIFGDWPDMLALVGTACIIAAGLWLWRSSTRAGKPVEDEIVETPT